MNVYEKIFGFQQNVIFLMIFLKWYYDQKNRFYFSSDFETLFTKHTTCEILSLNFEKKAVYLDYNFPIQWSAIVTPERIQ